MTLYAQVKTKFGLEKYLNLITNSRERQAVTKMRISAHSLPIETGRYKGIDTNDRICPLCYQGVGTEAHYFTKCQNNKIINTNNLFTRKLIDINSTFTLLSCENIFIYIMSMTDENIIKTRGKYILNILSNYNMEMKGKK